MTEKKGKCMESDEECVILLVLAKGRSKRIIVGGRDATPNLSRAFEMTSCFVSKLGKGIS
jgi:hypothetical protein